MVIWTGSEEQFEEFFQFLNSFHPTIKFDDPMNNSEGNFCEFLDLKISIEEGKICTDLFRKETSKPTALLPSSANPRHIIHNIVYSMAFRLLRICSSEKRFEARLKQLKPDFLLERKKKALEKKEKNRDVQKVIVVAPMDFNPLLPNLSQVSSKHYKSMIFKKPELKETFKDPPMAALRQPPNLRKILCKAKLSTIRRGDQFIRRSHRTAPG